MKNSLIKKEVIEILKEKLSLDDLGMSSIREIVQIVNFIEKESTVKFVRMEMGVPGLPSIKEGAEAQINAIRNNRDAVYPMIDGLPELKQQCSNFLKNFADITINAECCIPTAGSMQGTYAAFLTAVKCSKEKNTMLFIDPGFPVQKLQLKMQGTNFETFDIYDFRGDKLETKLESYVSKGNISAIIYSSPNNPSWITFTDEELQIIAKVADKYDAIVMEDLAYFGLDFRKDISKPGEPPYQPTVAKYTDNWVLFLSGSKMFSYAGPRCAMLCISPKLFDREYEGLQKETGAGKFGRALIYKVLYCLSAGVNHSAQYGLAELFKACNEGRVNFVEYAREYGEKTKIMKSIFLKHGFHIIYDKDGDEPIADGFYFTVGYKNMGGSELLVNFLQYGISAINLKTTGSTREGIRACSSHVRRDQFDELDRRLELFALDF